MKTGTIQKRINVLQKVYTDLNNGKYPGKGYATFANYYKGDTYFWKSLGMVGVVDFDKPCWNPIFAPNAATVKKVYTYYDKHFLKEGKPMVKKSPVLVPMQKATRPLITKTPEKKKCKEITILWGLFTYKTS